MAWRTWREESLLSTRNLPSEWPISAEWELCYVRSSSRDEHSLTLSPLGHAVTMDTREVVCVCGWENDSQTKVGENEVEVKEVLDEGMERRGEVEHFSSLMEGWV